MTVLTERRVRTAAPPTAAPPAPPVVPAVRVAPAVPATRAARRPAPWRAALVGLVAGFVVGLAPAAFVTQVLATQLPLGTTVVHGHTANVITLVLTGCVALAGAVFAAARSASKG